MPKWKVVDSYEPETMNASPENIQPMSVPKERKWVPVNSYIPPEQPEESSYNPLRHLQRSESRALETIGGAPKAGLNIMESLYGLIPESLRNEGIISKALPGGSVFAPLLSKAYEVGSGLLPSSENIREEIATRYPQGYLEPKNEYEQASDEFVQDLTSYLNPIGGGAFKVGKALKVALGSNLLGFATKKVTGSEKLGNAVKVGSVLFSTLQGFTPPDLIKEAEELYEKAGKSIKPGQRVSSSKILGLTHKIEDDFTKIGHRDVASKKKLQSFLDTIKKTGYEKLPPEPLPPEPSKIIQFGPGFGTPPKITAPIEKKIIEPKATIDLKHLWQLKKDIPDTLEKLEQGTQAYKHINHLRKEIDTVLKSGIGNKAFSNNLRQADQLYSTAMKVKDIKEEAAKALKSEGAKTALAYSFIQDAWKTSYKYLLGKAIIGAPFIKDQAKEMLELIKNNPQIASSYRKLLESAAKDNTNAVVRYGLRLNQALEKEKAKKKQL
jgi:hypothetical protein